MLAVFFKRLIVTLLLAYCAICSVLYFGQEFFIFPLLKLHFFAAKFDDTSKSSPPQGIESFFATTKDNEKIEVWTTFKAEQKPKNVALIFHGNGETIAAGNFLPFFKKLGIPAFTFDYRGYRNSSGWPSEKGLYLDAEAVWSEIQTRTGLDASKLIILGNSIGSAPAAYLASKLSPKTLILLAGYSDFPTLISEKPFYAPFKFVLKYELPTKKYLKLLSNTCVILAHGKKDEVIPFSHLLQLKDSLKPEINLKVLESEDAQHNDIFYKVEDRLSAATKECLTY